MIPRLSLDVRTLILKIKFLRSLFWEKIVQLWPTTTSNHTMTRSRTKFTYKGEVTSYGPIEEYLHIGIPILLPCSLRGEGKAQRKVPLPFTTKKELIYFYFFIIFIDQSYIIFYL